MTADLDTREYLTFADQARAPRPGNHAMKAPVFHQYGRVEIADGSVFEPQTIPAPMPSPMPEAEGQDLSLTEKLGMQAFQQRNSDAFTLLKTDRPYQGLSWEGAPDGSPAPIHPPGDAVAHAAPVALSPASGDPLSARLKGRVAVGLVIVGGPGNLAFSPDDQTLVVSEVQNGLSFLAAEAPNKDVTFVHDISVLEVDVMARETGGFDAMKSPWRDAALAQLGYGPGLEGADAYARALRQKHGTDWAYIAFFTKYPVAHFAYASLGGPRLVMHFDNDGWGPEQIDRVFAHETGHIFHAPDEYAQSGCDCGGNWGYFGAPNTNCASCAPNGGVKCIMQSNDWAMCDATRLHLGYGGARDQQKDRPLA